MQVWRRPTRFAILEHMFEVAGGRSVIGGRSGRLVATAAALPPGPAAMRLLSQVDPEALDAAGRRALLEAWERNRGWLLAQERRAEVASRG
jgi:hypothetical protein